MYRRILIDNKKRDIYILLSSIQTECVLKILKISLYEYLVCLCLVEISISFFVLFKQGQGRHWLHDIYLI